MEKELLYIGAAYIRVSDERQDEYSPASQLKKVRDYAAKEGYVIPDEYVFYDDGISGKSTAKRGDFNRMMSVATDKSHPFDKIYVWKFSRFARNQEDAIVCKSILSKHKVSVVSVSEPIPDGSFGSLIERVIEWTDAYYLENLSMEVKRGMTEKVSRGEPTCAPPFGYIMKDGKYFPDEESGKADIVREVFNLYANGKKQREIAMWIGEKGIRTKFGKKPDNRLVDYMLHNHCYIGKIRYSTDGTRAVSKRRLDNENIMLTDGHHKPLISMELWNKVQKMLEEQKKAYPKCAKREQPIQYMLKGIVRCSSCGATLAMSTALSGKSKIRTLQCCNYNRGSCTVSHSVTIPKLNTALIEGLRQAIASQQFTIAPRPPKTPSKAQIDYDKLIAVEERKLARAKDAYLSEIDSIEQYKQNKEDISARIADLMQRRDNDTVKKIDTNAFSKKVSDILTFIEREDVTDQAKNEALRTIIEKVVYEKANGNLAIYFHDI